ncbi:transcriptional repressor LexA [Patescibacteria group bacterium]|nr:transcriptional repressor LexA [Patescibacteria group bacterium]MBU1868325.1 transcriptional repressor LexA [Patescibacteria group bacterium]
MTTKTVKRNLTPKQKKILDFITLYYGENGFAPSLEEIGRNFRLKAVSTVHQHVKTLRSKGYLKKEINQPRGITPLAKSEDTVEIPLLGLIAAGNPIEVIENPEPLLVNKQLLAKSGEHYALRVIGNSMLDEGIFDGDTVIVREQKTAENGETVVAIIGGNEATLKKIYRERDCVRLQPANQAFLPLFPKEIEIRGKVISIIRNVKRDKSEPIVDEFASTGEKYQRRVDYSWDFRRANTKTYTHCFHNYPAMFIPQLARRLILSYSKEEDTICDIFCGSGTALVEARLLGRNSYGIDLNPFAIFLAQAKTTELSPVLLRKQYGSLLDSISRIDPASIYEATFFNIDFWFKEKVIIELARIKMAINGIDNEKIKGFFLAAFSNTARKCSNTKNGEFKLVRIPKDKLETYDPNVLETFKSFVERNIKGMQDYWGDVDKSTWTKPIYGNSSENNAIKKQSIDLIITSPPYGDSRTTVAYGQFSRLSLQWLDLAGEKPTEIDKELLGGIPAVNLQNRLESEYLAETLEEIAGRDEKRARDVLSFYIDLEKCLRQAYRILKKDKYFCLVIGNRLVKQVRIPTDFIIAELCENIGFRLMDIFVRNIPNKRMPLKNSPTNVAGKLEETMCKESIVVLKKT